MITTQVYLIMYLLMFVAAVQLRRKHPEHPRGYRALMGVEEPLALVHAPNESVDPNELEAMA